jgi:NitT/TauT family transport system substrate-binding protein
MKHCWFLLITVIFFSACGQSDEDSKRLSTQEKAKLKTEDSLALKVGVTPTIDCLPIFVAKESRMFDTLGVDVRLRLFSAQMDCDTALTGGSVEGSVTDLVRAFKIEGEGTMLIFPISTNLYWQLITNRNARLRELKQLNDKMLAVTRFSGTDYFADYVLDSVKLKHDYVYRPQINDVLIRLNMILNNEMDAMFLPEPQATAARMAKHKVIMDSRDKNINFGVIAFRYEDMRDSRRNKQLKYFIKAYDMAVDSINRYGTKHYSSIIQRYCSVKKNVADSLPSLKFVHHATPRQNDIEKAKAWLTSKGIGSSYKAKPANKKVKIQSDKNKKLKK